MSATTIPQRATQPGLVAVLASAVRVWALSPLAWFAAAAGIWGLVSTAVLVGSGGTTWDRFLAFQNLWVVAIGPAFTAVMAGYLAHTEASCRRGATLFRAIAPWRRRTAQTAVLWTWSTLLQAVVLAVAVATYAAAGAGDVPLARAATDAAVLLVALTLASVGYAAVLVVAGEIAGLLGCAGLALVFIVVAAATAESPWWWASPPAWQLRPTLDLIGTHANGTALNGQAVGGAPLALALSVLLAVLALAMAPVAAALLTTRRRDPGAPASTTPARQQQGSRRLRGGSMTSVVMVVRGSGPLSLAALAVALSVALLRWRPPGEVAIVWALIALPLGSAIIPALWIPRLRTGLRAVATRPPPATGWGWRLMVAMATLVSAASLIVATALAAAGMKAATAALFAGVLCVIGALLVSLSAWLVTTVGTFGCLLATSCATVVGLLVATNENMTASLGYLIPWAWAGYLDADHLAITMPTALAATAITATLATQRITAHPAQRH